MPAKTAAVQAMKWFSALEVQFRIYRVQGSGLEGVRHLGNFCLGIFRVLTISGFGSGSCAQMSE